MDAKGEAETKEELLEELKACRNMVYDHCYTPAQRKKLKELEKEGRVALAWVVVPFKGS